MCSTAKSSGTGRRKWMQAAIRMWSVHSRQPRHWPDQGRARAEHCAPVICFPAWRRWREAQRSAGEIGAQEPPSAFGAPTWRRGKKPGACAGPLPDWYVCGLVNGFSQNGLDVAGLRCSLIVEEKTALSRRFGANRRGYVMALEDHELPNAAAPIKPSLRSTAFCGRIGPWFRRAGG